MCTLMCVVNLLFVVDPDVKWTSNLLFIYKVNGTMKVLGLPGYLHMSSKGKSNQNDKVKCTGP